MSVDPGQMVPQHPPVLHRTPVHHLLLSLVAANEIGWLPHVGVSGAPARTGKRITDPALLVAFFELRRAGLIELIGHVVAATFLGERTLAVWAVCHV